jgi:hypothetical protein
MAAAKKGPVFHLMPLNTCTKPFYFTLGKDIDVAQKLRAAGKVKSMIGKQMEYALVDVREQEEFSKGIFS